MILKDIIFRGVYKRTNTPVYGCLLYGVGIDQEQICQIEVVNAAEHRVYDVFPDSVAQYTGRKDANDRNIYEDDLLMDISGKIHSVSWDDDCLQWKLSNGDGLNDGDNYGAYFVVVGNLFQNFDLIMKTQPTNSK